MVLVVAMLGFFCLVGLTVRRFDMRVRWILLVGIALMVMLDFVLRAKP